MFVPKEKPRIKSMGRGRHGEEIAMYSDFHSDWFGVTLCEDGRGGRRHERDLND